MKYYFFIILGVLALNSQSAPTIVDFNVANGTAYTTSANVTLNIYSLDTNKMNFSCDNDVYGSWVNYSKSYAFNLKSGAGCSGSDGNITVYAKAWNIDGNTFAT